MRVRGYQLGVQSWCFRTYKTNEDVIKAVREAGLDAIELCPVHADAADSHAVDAALQLYRNNGITVTSYGVARFVNDEAAVRPLYELATKAGFKAISADPDPDALPLLERLCNEYGIKLAVHNHGRKHRYGSYMQLDELFGKTTSNIGLCLDTAWMLDSGENPVATAEKYADRLYGVHVKDFIFDRNGAPEDVIVGTGNLDLPQLFATLTSNGFSGYLTLEYEGDEKNPVPSVRECVEKLGQLG